MDHCLTLNPHCTKEVKLRHFPCMPLHDFHKLLTVTPPVEPSHCVPCEEVENGLPPVHPEYLTWRSDERDRSPLNPYPAPSTCPLCPSGSHFNMEDHREGRPPDTSNVRPALAWLPYGVPPKLEEVLCTNSPTCTNHEITYSPITSCSECNCRSATTNDHHCPYSLDPLASKLSDASKEPPLRNFPHSDAPTPMFPPTHCPIPARKSQYLSDEALLL